MRREYALTRMWGVVVTSIASLCFCVTILLRVNADLFVERAMPYC
jgi:hypothetical protein